MKRTSSLILRLSVQVLFLILTWQASYFYYRDQHSNDSVVSPTVTEASFPSKPSATVPSSSCPPLPPIPTTLPVLPKRQPTDKIVHVAVVLSLSKDPSHIAEFHLLYESWRFIQIFTPLSEQVIIDLIVFCEFPSCYQLPVSCVPLSRDQRLNLIADCFYHRLDHHIVQDWKDYLYMTSIAFMLTPQYREAVLSYRWILRVDQDALLSPALLLGLLRKHPHKLFQMQFGGIGHGIEYTNNRLRMIANKLGYKHVGVHNLCSTWLVSPRDSIRIANLTTRIGRYLLQNEFLRRIPGLGSLSIRGEWPKWWRGVTSLYAGEIAINHIYASTLGHEHESPVLDHPADSDGSLWNVWHIHCLHNPSYFAKFRHRNDLYDFLRRSQSQRIRIISDYYSAEKIIQQLIDEFNGMHTRNETMRGTVSVRDYVTILAWRKAYAATGAINLQ